MTSFQNNPAYKNQLYKLDLKAIFQFSGSGTFYIRGNFGNIDRDQGSQVVKDVNATNKIANLFYYWRFDWKLFLLYPTKIYFPAKAKLH